MKLSFNWSRKDRSKPLGFSVEDCLSTHEANRLRELDFTLVGRMDSVERVKLFTEMLGEQKAIFVNTRLERDVILPNQKAGLMNWLSGLEDIEPKWRNEMEREIANLAKPLDKTDMNSFIRKMAELKVGVGVTHDEQRTIFDLHNKVQEAKRVWTAGGSATAYNEALRAYESYVASLMPKDD